MSIEDVVEVSPPPAPNRRRLIGIGAVVALLVAGGGVAAWAGTRGAGGTGAASAGGELTCPQTPGSQGSTEVPAMPTASGVDGRVVPAAGPDSVLVCEFGAPSYTLPGPADVAPVPESVPAGPLRIELSLQRQGTFAGDDDGVTPLVAALQGASIRSQNAVYDCAAPVGPQLEYLVGLTYGDGVVWVTAGYCTGAFNGVVTGEVDVRPQASAALDVAPDTPVSSSPEPASSSPFYSAPPQPLPGSASGGSTGSPGTGSITGGGANPGAEVDDPLAACVADTPANSASAERFVPFTPTGVRICHLAVDPAGASTPPVEQSATVAADLTAKLGTLPVLPPDGACPAIGGEVWALLFTGAGGTQELVTVDAGGCGTASNGLRTATADDALYTALRTLD